METSNFDKKIIDHLKLWIKNFVIELNLCPFAHNAISKDSVLYNVIESQDAVFILQEFQHTLIKLDTSTQFSTGFMIFPKSFDNFKSYLEMVEICQHFLVETGWFEKYQIASFHPEYLFEGESPHDNSHYTNRSPYPLIHILEVEELSIAIDHHHDTAQIPIRNKAKLNQMSITDILKLRS